MQKHFIPSFTRFLFSVLFFITTQTSAQDFVFGLSYGYGNTSFIRQSDNLKSPVYTTHRAACNIEFSPYYSKLFIITGAEYEMQETGNNIIIPLSVRITAGNTLRPYIEGGGYYSYSLTDVQDDYIKKNDFGAKVAAGLMIVLKKRWRLELGYCYRAGLTTAAEDEIPLPLNQVTVEQYRRKAGAVEVAVKYRFY